jgi:S-adenosylhomocysteine hydrolase
MRHFPWLPVLEDVIERSVAIGTTDLSGLGLVCCQHLLSTTGSLIESLITCGLDPKLTFILGKVYSSNCDVVQKLQALGCTVLSGSHATEYGVHLQSLRKDADRLWALATDRFGRRINKVVILDDGGMIHVEFPKKLRSTCRVAGVEQTTFGIGHHSAIKTCGVPVVNVASSAAKRHYETPLICDALASRVKRLLGASNDHKSCGVIGLGTIGMQLTKVLRASGKSVYGFDKDAQRTAQLTEEWRCNSAKELVERAEIIFGCAGDDAISQKDVLSLKKATRVFVSCSTGDIEFRGILASDFRWSPSISGVQSDDECPTIETEYPPNVKLSVLRSGYPVNFDNSPESVPSRDIQLTRGLLLSAVLQATRLLTHRNREVPLELIKLDPIMQRNIVKTWCDHTGRNSSALPEVAWFSDESRGLLIE